MAAPHVAGAAALLYSQGITNPAAIEAALREAGTVARAAERLGLERSHLYKKLRKHRLPY